MSSNQITRLIQEELTLRNKKSKSLNETSNRFSRFSKFRNKLNEEADEDLYEDEELELNEVEEVEILDDEGATEYAQDLLRDFCKKNPFDLYDTLINAIQKQIPSIQLEENDYRQASFFGYNDTIELGNINPKEFGIFNAIIKQLKIHVKITVGIDPDELPYLMMSIEYKYEHPSGGTNGHNFECNYYRSKWSLRN